MKTEKSFKLISIAIVTLWVSIFISGAFLIVIFISLKTAKTHDLFGANFTLQNYLKLIDPLVLKVIIRSSEMALATTLFCLLIGYPFAYCMTRLPRRWQALISVLLIIPFWTSSLIRSYAILAILKANGLLNKLLIFTGIIETPLSILFTNAAVLTGLVYDLLPFMIFPIYMQLEKLDKNLIHAASDLGATAWTTMRRIIVPLSMPGIMTGVIFVFLPAMTLFYIPDLLGGAHSMLLGNFIQFQFLTTNNWQGGAATSIVLTTFLLILMMSYRLTTRSTKG